MPDDLGDQTTDDVANGLPPDVVELLTTDHRRIEDLLEAGDRWTVLREMSSHLVAETQLVYPELRRHANEDDLVDAAMDGDHWLEEALSDIDKEKVADVSQVAELFAAHVERMEAGLFPLLRATVDLERRVALADSLQEVLRTAPTHPHPHNPDHGFFEVVADAVSSEIDQLRDAYHEGKEDR
jgi:hypothetical protein